MQETLTTAIITVYSLKLLCILVITRISLIKSFNIHRKMHFSSNIITKICTYRVFLEVPYDGK